VPSRRRPIGEHHSRSQVHQPFLQPMLHEEARMANARDEILPTNRVGQHPVHGVGRDYGSVTTTVRNRRRDSDRHHCPGSAPDSLRPGGPSVAVTRSKTLARRSNHGERIPPWFGLPRPHSHRSRGTQRRRMRGRGNPHHGFINGWRPLRGASHRWRIRCELRLVVILTTPKF
jgi:hypothetical protein